MAKTDDQVMALVVDELKKNPDATLDELQSKAKEVNSSVGKLTRRQFNARYPLQVKRRMQAGGSKRRGRGGARKAKPGRKAAGARKAAATSGEVNREAMRDTFLRFASDLAAAEARKDLVKVLAGVDKYVDQAVKAAGR